MKTLFLVGRVEVLVAVGRGEEAVSSFSNAEQFLNSHEGHRHTSYSPCHTETVEAWSNVEDETSAFPSDRDLREILSAREDFEHRLVDL